MARNLLAADVTLSRPNVVRVVDHLTLQIADVHLVGVHQAQGSDARSGQIQRGGRAQPARADDQHLGREQLLLTIDPHVLQDDVAAVPLDLFIRQREFHGRLP
jgi:hypothetical protein